MSVFAIDKEYDKDDMSVCCNCYGFDSWSETVVYTVFEGNKEQCLRESGSLCESMSARVLGSLFE